jgi:hypothetical protein
MKYIKAFESFYEKEVIKFLYDLDKIDSHLSSDESWSQYCDYTYKEEMDYILVEFGASGYSDGFSSIIKIFHKEHMVGPIKVLVDESSYSTDCDSNNDNFIKYYECYDDIVEEIMDEFGLHKNILLENRISRHISNFTEDELIDIENVFLEYADKYNIKDIKIESDEDDPNENHLLFDINVSEFQYEIARYKNLAIDIYYIGNREIGDIIFNDIKINFTNRITKVGYSVISCSRTSSQFRTNSPTYMSDRMWDISIVIGKP